MYNVRDKELPFFNMVKRRERNIRRLSEEMRTAFLRKGSQKFWMRSALREIVRSMI